MSTMTTFNGLATLPPPPPPPPSRSTSYAGAAFLPVAVEEQQEPCEERPPASPTAAQEQSQQPPVPMEPPPLPPWPTGDGSGSPLPDAQAIAAIPPPPPPPPRWMQARDTAGTAAATIKAGRPAKVAPAGPKADTEPAAAEEVAEALCSGRSSQASSPQQAASEAVNSEVEDPFSRSSARKWLDGDPELGAEPVSDAAAHDQSHSDAPLLYEGDGFHGNAFPPGMWRPIPGGERMEEARSYGGKGSWDSSFNWHESRPAAGSDSRGYRDWKPKWGAVNNWEGAAWQKHSAPDTADALEALQGVWIDSKTPSRWYDIQGHYCRVHNERGKLLGTHRIDVTDTDVFWGANHGYALRWHDSQRTIEWVALSRGKAGFWWRREYAEDDGPYRGAKEYAWHDSEYARQRRWGWRDWEQSWEDWRPRPFDFEGAKSRGRGRGIEWAPAVQASRVVPTPPPPPPPPPPKKAVEKHAAALSSQADFDSAKHKLQPEEEPQVQFDIFGGEFIGDGDEVDKHRIAEGTSSGRQDDDVITPYGAAGYSCSETAHTHDVEAILRASDTQTPRSNGESGDKVHGVPECIRWQ